MGESIANSLSTFFCHAPKKVEKENAPPPIPPAFAEAAHRSLVRRWVTFQNTYVSATAGKLIWPPHPRACGEPAEPWRRSPSDYFILKNFLFPIFMIPVSALTSIELT